MIESIDESTVDEWNAIACVYRLCSRLLICEVDADFFDQLSQPPLKASFVELGGALPPSWDSDTLDDLSADFCQLFIGPSKHFPPYQSVWEQGQFQSRTVESVKSYMEIARYSPGKLPANTMLDHLGLQLDLMRHILAQVAFAPSEDERDMIIDLASAFSSDHLQWSKSMLSAAAEKSQTTFYQSSLKLIDQFLESERQFWHARQR